MIITTSLSTLLILLVVGRTLRRRLILGTLLLLFYLALLIDSVHTEINSWAGGVQAIILLIEGMAAVWALRSAKLQTSTEPQQARTPKGNGILE